MTEIQARFEELIAALKKCEYRLTPQRIELVRLIAASEGHPSALQLYEKIKAQFPTISHATVYKTLALLKEMGQVLEIDLHDDSHYDGNDPKPHPHLICINCGRIMDGTLDLEPQVLEKLEETTGFKIIRPQVSFYGYCSDCKEKAAAGG
jgi:Fur family transcriptional regulator, peroxide stress response regulator